MKYSKDYWLVTSCTESYLPGLVALRNSVKLNFKEAKLACFYYGEETPDVEEVEFILNAPMLGPVLDDLGVVRHGLKLGPDMFARLLIPKYFKGRAFYLDVDCLLLNTIKELWDIDLFDYPTACVPRQAIGWIGGHRYDDMASGTYLCDTDRWEDMGLVEECFQIMKDKVEGKIKRDFHVNVESALSYAHDGKFLELGPEYQILTYYGSMIKSDKVAHFAGPKPWHIKGYRFVNKRPVKYVGLWNAYLKNDKNLIKEATDKLSEVRPRGAWNQGRRNQLCE